MNSQKKDKPATRYQQQVEGFRVLGPTWRLPNGSPMRHNAAACGYWNGYEGKPNLNHPRGSAGAAAYRAGVLNRRADDKKKRG